MCILSPTKRSAYAPVPFFLPSTDYTPRECKLIHTSLSGQVMVYLGNPKLNHMEGKWSYYSNFTFWRDIEKEENDG